MANATQPTAEIRIRDLDAPFSEDCHCALEPLVLHLRSDHAAIEALAPVAVDYPEPADTVLVDAAGVRSRVIRTRRQIR